MAERLAEWREAGWESLDPLHAKLVSYEATRTAVDDPDWRSVGPVVSWPYGRTLLARHRFSIAEHATELSRTRKVEASR